MIDCCLASPASFPSRVSDTEEGYAPGGLGWIPVSCLVAKAVGMALNGKGVRGPPPGLCRPSAVHCVRHPARPNLRQPGGSITAVCDDQALLYRRGSGWTDVEATQR